MAIGTNAAIEYFGTRDALGTTTSAVADGAFSDGTNDLLAWTNDDDAPWAAFVLTGQYPSGTLDAIPFFVLHARLIDVLGTTGDTPVPDANHSPHQLGIFNWNPDLAATTDDDMVVITKLPNTRASQEYNFYIENTTGVSLSAGWELEVIPFTEGPHA